MVTNLRLLSRHMEWVLVACSMSGVTACQPLRTCVEEVQPGHTYRVTLLEVYDENASVMYESGRYPIFEDWSSCEGRDAVGVGSRLEFTVSQEPDEADELRMCRVPSASLSPREGFMVKSYGYYGYSANYLALTVINASVMLPDGCTGVWRLTPMVIRKDLFATPVPGERPPVLVEREFLPDWSSNPSCRPFKDPQHGFCSDVWVAQLEAL